MSTSFVFHFRPSTKSGSGISQPYNVSKHEENHQFDQNNNDKRTSKVIKNRNSDQPLNKKISSSVKPTPQLGSIFLRIIHNRKTVNITTPYRIYPDEWNPTSRSLILPEGDSPRMKYLIDSQDSMNRDLLRLTEIVINFEKQGFYTLEQIKSVFVLSAKDNTLTSFVEKLAIELCERGQERTARAYFTAANGLIRFNKGRDLRLDHINSSLIRAYEKELKSQGKSMNTISFYMRNLRAITNKAIAKGCIHVRQENPFAGVYTGVFITRKRALTKSEIKLFNELDTSISGAKNDLVATDTSNTNNATSSNAQIRKPVTLTPELKSALAMFLFCFHARGMSFVDMAYLTKSNVKKGTIRYFRKKTGQLLEVKITPVMRRIIDHFEKQTRYGNYVFPIIKDTNRSLRLQYESGLRTQNERLKHLAELAGIDKRVSTHVARHSWATIAKNEKLPLWVISEGLGHTNEKTTYTYLASFDRSVIDQASDTISRAVRRVI